MSVDKTAFTTELGTDNTATITLTSQGGFTGDVTVAATIAGATTWTVAVDQPTVTLAAGAVATVKAKVTIPSLNEVGTGTLNLAVTGNGATQNFAPTFTVNNIVTLVITENAAGQCVYPTVQATQVKSGTEIHWLNMSNDITGMIIHSDGNAGIAHEPQGGPGTPINQFYAQTGTAATVTSDHWYCHNLNDPGTGQVIVVNP